MTVKDYSGDIEDGIPSAHCCASVMLLYYAISSTSAAGYLSSDMELYAQLTAAAWVIWIAYGRLYLGVHSLVDLVAGAALGWMLLALWQQIEQPFIAWVVTSQHLQWQALLVAFVLLRTYPMASRYTDTFNYAIAWLGGWAGVLVGYRCVFPAVDSHHAADAAALFRWGSALAHPNSSNCSLLSKVASESASSCAAPAQQQELLIGLIPMVVVKIFVGLVTTAVTKVVVKKVLLRLLQPMFGCVPHRIRCLWQPPVVGMGKCDSANSSSAIVRPQEEHMHERVLLHSGHKQNTFSDHTATNPVVACSTVAGLKSGWEGFWVLRHDRNGVAYDAIFTAKFMSYVAVGYVIVAMDLWWQPLMSHLVFRSSIA
eukprot:GHUV01028484.1.p1 GENE.GHUV01028484.1~~GHUV01028484.1.p1  ORF type:complete len:370 (+),score=93.47 GHUV01028484.1:565-1674(+)